MAESISVFLGNIAQACINIAVTIYDATDTWQLVFAGISILLITRFIIGPIVGFTITGGSDVVSRPSSISRDKKVSASHLKYRADTKYKGK